MSLSHIFYEGDIVMHKGRATLAAILPVITLIAGCGSLASDGAGSTSGGADAGTSSAATVSVTHRRERILFKVWGSAPDGAQITYGTDSTNLSPKAGLGFDGEGSAVPWAGHLRYTASADYWYVSAQLQGSGDIQCGVYAQVTDWFSDGTHKTLQKRLAHGHAAGGYNICQAEST